MINSLCIFVTLHFLIRGATTEHDENVSILSYKTTNHLFVCLLLKTNVKVIILYGSDHNKLCFLRGISKEFIVRNSTIKLLLLLKEITV